MKVDADLLAHLTAEERAELDTLFGAGSPDEQHVNKFAE
jgi:hypothetical protein